MGPTTEIDSWIGQRLRSLREENSVTAAWLAARVGISPERLEQIECGEERADAHEVASAALVLNIDLEKFFPEQTGPVEFDEESLARQQHADALLRIVAQRGRLNEAYRMLWNLALS
jgi:transcriptional regulator with XRE-family HTH domain